jgi:hypothetical protein
MGLKAVLERNKVPLPPDFEERMDIVIAALRRSPSYEAKMKAFKRNQKQSGGQSTEDWLGPQLVNFMDVVTSPAARDMLRGVFAVIFFVSYLEKIPVFGNILSATLDLMIMGGKMLVKTVQKNLPPLIGLIPIPFASLLGIMMAAMFGFIMWPIIAIVSLSRQDFTAAVESFIRVIPPPFGDTIADLFLEGNRTVARLNQKRIALANDISKAFETISNAFGEVAQGATQLGQKTKEVAKQGVREVKDLINEPSAPAQAPVPTPTETTAPGTPAPEPTPEAPPSGNPQSSTPSGNPPQTAGRRHRFSRRPRRKHKWRTQRRIN